jgi:PPIC-type PPIASE domain
VKRFLVLLALLAGGLLWAVLAVPSNAAVVNGTAISQQSLSDDVSAIAGSADYQCYLNAQAAISSQGQAQLPPVSGAGKGQGGQNATATTAFAGQYLDSQVGHELVLQLAATHGITVTPAQEADARAAYEQQISNIMAQAAQQTNNPRYTCGATQPLTGQQILSTLPASFVDEQVQFFATLQALQEELSGVGTSPAELQAYFEQHRSMFDTVCWTGALYSNVDAANAALQQAQTTPFSQVAAQSQGGPQGCLPLPVIQSKLPSSIKLDQLATGTVSFPVAIGNGEYVLVQVTKRTPTSYQAARSIVAQVVQQNGSARAQRAIQAAERRASVSVDPRYGVWVPVRAQVLVPFVPAASDILNASANNAPLFAGPAAG